MSQKPGSRDGRVPPGIRQRARPHLLLVDADFRVVHYEPAALKLLAEFCGAFPPGRLPRTVESAVRSASAKGHATVSPVAALLVHVSKVQGGETSFLALLVERESRRAPLASAARKFALTKREREVLLLVMRGMHAVDIARELSLSQSTVTGYLKTLLRKTETRSRSEMIAKVLGWEEGEAGTVSV